MDSNLKIWMVAMNLRFEWCNGCHDLRILYINISNIATLSLLKMLIVNNSSKSEGISLLENSMPKDCGYI